MLSSSVSETQRKALLNDICILTDEKGKQIGVGSKLDTHKDGGKLHRAFSVLFLDLDGCMFVQRRALSKPTFPGIWANACCSHPLSNIEGEDETGPDDAVYGLTGVKKAVKRRLYEELSIPVDTFDSKDIEYLFSFEYEANDGDWVEHEFDNVVIIRRPRSFFDSICKINPDEICECKWISIDDLSKSKGVIDGSPISPWLQIIIKYLVDNKVK